MISLFKNLLHVIKRFKTAVLLNIFGLSVAFAAFIVIMMQVDYDYSFDNFHEDGEKIYRAERLSDGGSRSVLFSLKMAELLLESPDILSGSIITKGHEKLFFSVYNEDIKSSFLENTVVVDSNYTKLFDFTMVDGLAGSLNEPDNVLIPRSMAIKFFGQENVAGRELKGEKNTLIIGGVYRDFPSNSIVKNYIYQPLTNKKEKWGAWSNMNREVFLKIQNPDVLEKINGFYQHALKTAGADDTVISELAFTPLKDLHFVTDVMYDKEEKANKQTVALLFILGFLIILIAAVNFTNFSIALSPARITSITTRKVLGADLNGLRFSLLSEAVLITILSFFISLLIVFFASKTFIAGLIDPVIYLPDYWKLLLFTAFVAVITGTLSGLYPAIYITSFPAVLALKGSFGFSPGGKNIRTVLISLQFISSFILIISVSFMYLQNHYLRKIPLGYDKDQLIMSDVSPEILKNKIAFSDKLLSNAGIDGVTFTESLLSSSDFYTGRGREFNGRQIGFETIEVDPEFLKVMGIDVSEGRDFTDEDRNIKGKSVSIFNEKARTEYDLKLNDKIGEFEIIGFIPDVKYKPLRMVTEPLGFFVGSWNTRYVYIKAKAGSDMFAVMDFIKETFSGFDPDRPFEIRFYNDLFNTIYEKERQLTSLIAIFSIISILISLIGVFGMVIYETSSRTKEISIRKVLGSSVGEILELFNRTYLNILSVCFLIACPLVFYLIHTWLDNFAYRTPVYLWVFLAGGCSLFLITIATVTWQSWRAATANPVDGLRKE